MNVLRGRSTYNLYAEYPHTIYGMHALRRRNELTLYTE